MNSFRRVSSVALTLVLAAGMSYGQTTAERKSDQRTQEGRRAESGQLDFYRGSKLIGMNVANPNDEVVASIQDFIVDRGSGRIEHALLKSGAVLGIGGKTIAVPYARLRFDEAEKRFELNITPEQIDRAVSFVPENWSELQNTGWADKLDRWWYGDTDDAALEDSADRAIATLDRETVKGTIQSVDRTRGAGRGERVVVTVKTDDGKSEALILGPSWFVMGDDAAPMRGDSIEAVTVKPGEDEHGRRLVVSAKIDGDTLVLRDEDGRPRWRMDNPDAREGDAAPDNGDRGRRAGRLVLLSQVIGADAMTTDKTGGEVHDVVIERSSGQIALVGFDPNENLLGIADEIKAVPWQVVSVGPDQKVRIDAGSEMLKSVEKLPDDVTVYETAGRLDPVYSSFSVSPTQFRMRDREEARGTADDSWGKDGVFTKAFSDGPDATVTGRVIDVRTTALQEGMPDARVVTVATGDGERMVILGPEWYLKRQTLKVDDGARVTIHGKRGRIGDKEYVCAHSIEADGRSLTLWESNQPMWNGQ